ncbi:unnamed protein product [Adineta steineri]|uniref:NAD(P)(+)--arginine ADP-ribosyltransferase n=1 Tax=Adineta steineri TaxID=433720 RepID=A0A818I6I7_9BILA|nr:unnamed protein product [Adineta steineri]CAF0941723.1 unnamed protein product [Adineta steineri]CAF1097039.1 unnamed protein product [Adineta steineri]CAF3518409.1 unnamed protein product [Adineta steineri]CAF3557778.1 unnamed protein product [Adineta steineri]
MATAVKDIDYPMISLTQRHRRLVETSIVEQNLKTTDPVNALGEQTSPLAGYNEEPLLPLAEACAPLANIISNLSVYIQIALNQTTDQLSHELTIDESASVRLYTMEWDEPNQSLYWMLNRALRKADHKALLPYFKYLKLFLTALVKLPCVPPQTVWRGVTANLSKNFPCGAVLTWWDFSSCTTSLTVLENNMYLGNVGERTLFSVETINGRKIRAHSYFDFEDEILLLPGTYMEVQSQLTPAVDLCIIHLKQVKPNETLLELPFEGNLKY